MSNLADSAEAAANGQAVILRGRAALLPEDAAVDDDLDVPVEARGYWEGVWLRLKRDKLALAGGCALNSVANGKLFERTGFRELFVQPAAGDDGTAIGAAFYVEHSVLGRSRRYVMRTA